MNIILTNQLRITLHRKNFFNYSNNNNNIKKKSCERIICTIFQEKTKPYDFNFKCVMYV